MAANRILAGLLGATAGVIGRSLFGEISEKRIGNYLLNKPLDFGAYGEVVECTNITTNEIMAMKIVPRSIAREGLREVEMLLKLKQLGLDKNKFVQFSEHLIHRGNVCMVFEKLDRDLYNLIKERDFKPLHVSEIREVSKQLLEALDALKKVNMVHTDVKPDNVMLVNQKEDPFKVKVIDFGLARPTDELSLGDELQAPGYKAPEVILGLPLNEAVDMWGLGCVMGFLHLGKRLHSHYPYDAIKEMVDSSGQPPNHVLDKGLFTQFYFDKVEGSPDSSWKLKRFSDDKKPGPTATAYLNELPKVCEEKGKEAECEETLAFMDLLKRMLHMDPNQRITPSEALQHCFITKEPCDRGTNVTGPVTAGSLTKTGKTPNENSKIDTAATTKPVDDKPPDPPAGEESWWQKTWNFVTGVFGS